MDRKRNLYRLLSLFLAVCMLIGLLAGCGSAGTDETEEPDETEDPGPTASHYDPDNTDSTDDPDPTLDPDDGKAALVDLDGYAVSSSSSEASAAGLEILKKGGNAVDAAIAVAMALGVVEPYSSGLGGGGFMLVYDPAEDAAWSVDYYAAAGAAETKASSIGVPGLLKGMETARQRWGTMELSELLEPAVRYAEEGFEATQAFVSRMSYSGSLWANPAFSNVYKGATVVQADLADTLKRIQHRGIDAFYGEKIGDDIATASKLTVQDLADYEVYVEPALETEFQGMRAFSTMAPSSGLTTLQMLKLSDMMDIPSPETDGLGYINTLLTISKAAYQSRTSKVVDPRFHSFKRKKYLTEDYLNSLISTDPTLRYEQDPERRCTTQFSVIDANGMVVCATNTLSDSWGSYKLVDGFYLNNTLSNFGRSKKQAYEPGKRPRSHISPVIVVGEDNYRLAVGSPGGSNIPRIVTPIILDIVKFGTDAQAAVDKSRAMADDYGYLVVESAPGTTPMVDVKKLNANYYYSASRLFFGCTSVVGYSEASGVFAASDRRRTTSGSATEN